MKTNTGGGGEAKGKSRGQLVKLMKIFIEVEIFHDTTTTTTTARTITGYTIL